MKKIISLLLIAVMVLGMCVSVSAIDLENYTLIDSAYSPELDMYVVMAKNFSASGHTTQLYRSTDRIHWTSCIKNPRDGRNYANTHSRQELVWWEKEKVFVAQLGGITFTSSDGERWVQSSVISGSNGVIETDGEKLLIGAGRNMKIAHNTIDEMENITVSSNSNVYIKAAALSSAQETYIGIDGSTYGGSTYQLSGEERKLSTASPALKQTPIDSVKVPGQDKWLVVLNGMASYSILNSYDKADNIIPKTENGENSENITGIGAGDKYAIVGTAEGNLLYAPISEIENKDTVWNEVIQIEKNDSLGEIRSITKGKNGFLIGVSANEVFTLFETEEGVRLVDETKMYVESDTDKIETPQNGSIKTEVSITVRNGFGKDITSEILSVTCDDASNDVTAKWDGKKLVLDITDTADGIKTFTVSHANYQSRTFEILFVKESDVDIEGRKEIAYPQTGNMPLTFKYTPVVYGSNGEKMDRKASIELVSAPSGITFDPSKNEITTTDEAESGEIILKVTSDGKLNNTKDITIKVSLQSIISISVTTDVDSMIIPDYGKREIISNAEAVDQLDIAYDGVLVKWSIEGDNEGIEINEDTGVITINQNANRGNIFVVATYEENKKTLVGKKELVFTWSDNRIIKEDLAKIENEITTDKDLTFNLITDDETKLTWKSLDESIISSEGVIKRSAKADQKVNVVVTAKKNAAESSKNISVTVLRKMNISDISDFENDTEIENGTVTNEEAHNGEKSLSVNKNFSFKVTLEENSMYMYEAYVKAPQNVTLAVSNGNKSAAVSGKNDWQRIVTDSYYSKSGKNLEETLTFTSNEDFYIDDIVVRDITPEYENAADAVKKAEYTKSKTDVDNAQKILNDFYDVPSKKELQDRLNRINTNSGGSNSGGGGNGSSGGSSSGKNPSVIPPVRNTAGTAIIGTGATENNQEVIEDYLLVFKDLKGHWAKDDIEAMADLDIVSGVTENSFNPEADITRAEFTKLIVKTMGLSEAEYENTYYDVISDDWYAGFVQSAKNEGYITGYDGFFRPNDYITREEIAKVIVAAYYKKANKTLEQGAAVYFTDIPEISAWAYDYIAAASKEGFINGVTELRFAPKQRATRAQAVVMLKRLYDKLEA